MGPLRSELPEEAGAAWISSVPGTDTAVMSALLRTLVAEGLHDGAFLDRYTTGWPIFVSLECVREVRALNRSPAGSDGCRLSHRDSPQVYRRTA